MGEDFRTEQDSMGAMQVPARAYYGAQTARAIANFPISGLHFPRPFVKALGLIKLHAARANRELGRLDERLARAIEAAAREVAQRARERAMGVVEERPVEEARIRHGVALSSPESAGIRAW